MEFQETPKEYGMIQKYMEFQDNPKENGIIRKYMEFQDNPKETRNWKWGIHSE